MLNYSFSSALPPRSRHRLFNNNLCIQLKCFTLYPIIGDSIIARFVFDSISSVCPIPANAPLQHHAARAQLHLHFGLALEQIAIVLGFHVNQHGGDDDRGSVCSESLPPLALARASFSFSFSRWTIWNHLGAYKSCCPRTMIQHFQSRRCSLLGLCARAVHLRIQKLDKYTNCSPVRANTVRGNFSYSEVTFSFGLVIPLEVLNS